MILPLGAQEPVPVAPPETPAPAETSAPPAALRVVHYNLKNWLAMERRVRGEVVENAPKPEKEKQAAISLLAAARPDILSVCEIGADEDVADLQDRLRVVGVDLPHRARHTGADTTRQLAVLSRFPLTEKASLGAATYQAGEATLAFQRGVLDLEAEISPDYRLRLLSTHLKSRREVAEGDQAVMRRNEALLLREHVEKILSETPDANVLLTGDFNDTKNEQPVKLLQGRFGEKDYLRDLWLEDTDGYRFTYYWSFADRYERIDFAFVSDGLWPEIDSKQSHILKWPEWDQASDHRPLVITILPREKARRGR